MRLSFIFCLLFVCWARLGLGQGIAPKFLEQGEQKFFGGLTLGLNVSQVDGDTYAGFHQAGFNVGGLVQWFIVPQAALSFEFLYSQKGSVAVTESYNTQVGAFFSKYKLRLNYIETPLVLHYFFKERFFLSAGASFNALLSSKEQMEHAGMLVPFEPEEYLFERLSFDAIGGIGVFIWKNLMFETRYQYGLQPIRRAINVVPFQLGMGLSDQYNNMMVFRLIYLF